MDIPAAHNDAQGLSVMRSAPKLRPRTPMSGLVLPSCAQRRPWPAQAGTGTCVHIPIQLIPIASLAWLGKQQPCPLLSVGWMGLLETECDTHTHTHTYIYIYITLWSSAVYFVLSHLAASEESPEDVQPSPLLGLSALRRFQ